MARTAASDTSTKAPHVADSHGLIRVQGRSHEQPP